jgi:5'-nucleotidase
VGISSRALFDLTAENNIYESPQIESKKLEAFRSYQRAHEQKVLPPGGAFPLVRSLLGLNDSERGTVVDVVLMSRNHPDISHRIFNSIEHYGLSIRTAALTGGQPLAPYLQAYSVNLFLTKDSADVQNAIAAGVASGMIYDLPRDLDLVLDEIRFAFDGDGVLFSHEADRVYKEKGPKEYFEYERENAKRPLPDGPFAPVLRLIRTLQRAKEPKIRIRVALVTARNVEARERALRTLEAWDVRLDEAHFLGHIPKDRILEVFRPHIFFDDREDHCRAAATKVPTAEVLHPREDKHVSKVPISQLSFSQEDRRNRFLLVCKAFLRKDYATGEDKLTLWYRDNLSSWAGDHADRLIDELEVSVKNTPRGEQRRAVGEANDMLTKLLSFLSPLVRKHRPE